MKNITELMKSNAEALDFMEYEKPKLFELADVVMARVQGAGVGEGGEGSDVDFGAVFMEDHSVDYADFNLDE